MRRIHLQTCAVILLALLPVLLITFDDYIPRLAWGNGEQVSECCCPGHEMLVSRAFGPSLESIYLVQLTTTYQINAGHYDHDATAVLPEAAFPGGPFCKDGEIGFIQELNWGSFTQYTYQDSQCATDCPQICKENLPNTCHNDGNDSACKGVKCPWYPMGDTHSFPCHWTETLLNNNIPVDIHAVDEPGGRAVTEDLLLRWEQYLDFLTAFAWKCWDPFPGAGQIEILNTVGWAVDYEVVYTGPIPAQEEDILDLANYSISDYSSEPSFPIDYDCVDCAEVMCDCDCSNGYHSPTFTDC